MLELVKIGGVRQEAGQLNNMLGPGAVTRTG